jgi:N-methylhydantoinase A/oxoprolinase/acetone carboxylase beta subunit
MNAIKRRPDLMTLVIGLDTGGTYTDAALLNAGEGKVLTTGKALTTREDLSIGLGGAISRVLNAFDGDPAEIELVSLSTTLATNAVVEGVGGRVGLIMIGFDNATLERADLARALGQDPALFIAGGHKPDGVPQSALDVDAIRNAASDFGNDVSAFAIAGHFATRNPEHEIAARDLLRDLTGLPITCSHELSSSLGGPRRALTAVLNARLINLLERLIKATEKIMAEHGLTCPLMVVKGDGSLLHSDFARNRPVETVLSGPAASLSGAAFLAGKDTALIADIGGTTTDIAFLQNGTPRLRAEGALVGGWRTMVEAAEIRTCGLGGDSEVKAITRGRLGGVTLGPRRAVPLSLMAKSHPHIIEAMDEQLGLAVAMQTDARFVFPVMPDGVPSWLTRSETRLAEKALTLGIMPVAEIAATQLALGAVDRLISRGLLGLAAFTPTDAAHVTGSFTEFNTEAATKGAALMARQKSGRGEAIAKDTQEIAEITLHELYRRSSLALMDAGLAHDGAGEEQASKNPLLAPLFDVAGNTTKLVNINMQLGTGLVALGASAATHYPNIATLMGVDVTVPEHADVAGAVGAAVGSVRQRVMISITQPAEGRFRVHLPEGQVDLDNMDTALARARTCAKGMAHDRASSAGATDITVTVSDDIRMVPIKADRDLFIEAFIHATAEGKAGSGRRNPKRGALSSYGS